MIEVTNLTKQYGDHTAVDHLSFRVEKGQIYGFLGPNGAGKSTTMNIITGYIAPSEGTVTIDGKDIQKEPEEAKKQIGYLPEIPPLYVEMTVEEYLEFAAELKKIPGAERKTQIRKVMEMTGTEDVKRRLIRNLSKGYRQRVGLAQAMLGDPEVIILDEPSVGLDPKQIIEIRDLIRHLGENHTIILSSHILSEVSAICDHIMIISHGRLVASDSPEGLKKLMNHSQELQLTVKGGEALLCETLNKVTGVSSVEVLEAPGGGFARARAVSEEHADVREAVFYALAEARLPIMEMVVREKSLEDIFLELTEGVQPEEKERKKLFGSRKKKKTLGSAEGTDAEPAAERGTEESGEEPKMDRSAVAAERTVTESTGAAGQTVDKSTVAAEQTVTGSTGAAEQTADRSTGAAGQTADRSAEAAEQTAGRSAVAAGQTADRSAVAPRQTADRSAEAAEQTADRSIRMEEK